MNTQTRTCKLLAPEDVHRGDYVTPFTVMIEMLPFFEIDKYDRHIEPARAVVLPWDMCVLRVVDVCLPLVLVKRVDGTCETIDTRRYRLARVSRRFGRRTFKRLKPKTETEKTVAVRC